eukprot:368489-Lingulodinium_polyedra.AAC.1
MDSEAACTNSSSWDFHVNVHLAALTIAEIAEAQADLTCTKPARSVDIAALSVSVLGGMCNTTLTVDISKYNISTGNCAN